MYNFYPFLFVFYPVLALLAQNIGQVNPVVFARPIAFSIAFSLAIWLVTSLMLRNLQKSALLTFAIQLMFFSFGHILSLSKSVPVLSTLLQNHQALALLEIGLLMILALWVFRTKTKLYQVSSFLSLVSVILLAFPLFHIGQYYLFELKPVILTGSQPAKAQTLEEKPDIYLIILDSYSRQDVLKSDFGYDNQPFLDQLSSLGFQVIPCSRSNYNNTGLSLSTILNLDYASTIGIDAGSISQGINETTPRIRENRVRSFLEQIGYHIYAFETGFPTLDWTGTTQTFKPVDESWIYRDLLPIESMFIESTGLNVLMDSKFGLTKELKTAVDSPNADHIKLEKYILNKLPGTASLPGPKLVYAHLLLPHRPYVFDENGNIRTDTRFFSANGKPINDDFFRQGYIGQVKFVDNQISQILKGILYYSQKPPIIIVMGDHGYAWVDTYFENLMSIYLPDGKSDKFYPTISNVNLFRRILDDYFGQSYSMLPDMSYRVDLTYGTYVTAPETRPRCIKNPQN